MKKIFLLMAIMFLTYYQTTSQVLPIEDVESVRDDDTKSFDGITYVKDVNNKLGKFTGNWKGIHNGISYEVNIERVVFPENEIVPFKVDALNFKYKVISPQGNVIENTLDLEIGDMLVSKGVIYKGKDEEDTCDKYIFQYFGREATCGQKGLTNIWYFDHHDVLGMATYLTPRLVRGDRTTCLNRVQEVLPEKIISLTRSSTNNWLASSYVTITNENEKLKIGNVKNAWEGVKRELTELDISAGKTLNISLDFDKGTTNANVRLYVQELNADGSHSSWNVINGNLTTGNYNYKYTIKKGAGAILRVDKNNTHLTETTHFYLDNTKVSLADNTVDAP